MTAAMKLKDACFPWKERSNKSRQHIKKWRYNFSDKGLQCQSYGFSREFDHKEGWAPKNWCFWIVGLRRLLRVRWTGRRSNQSVLKEINPEYSLEGLMLKMKLHYFGHLMQRRPWYRKRLGAGGEGDDRGWDGWTASLAQRTWVWAGPCDRRRPVEPGVLRSTESRRAGHTRATEQQPPADRHEHGHRQTVRRHRSRH